MPLILLPFQEHLLQWIHVDCWVWGLFLWSLLSKEAISPAPLFKDMGPEEASTLKVLFIGAVFKEAISPELSTNAPRQEPEQTRPEGPIKPVYFDTS